MTNDDDARRRSVARQLRDAVAGRPAPIDETADFVEERPGRWEHRVGNLVGVVAQTGPSLPWTGSVVRRLADGDVETLAVSRHLPSRDHAICFARGGMAAALSLHNDVTRRVSAARRDDEAGGAGGSLRGRWDDFFDSPGIDFPNRSQP